MSSWKDLVRGENGEGGAHGNSKWVSPETYSLEYRSVPHTFCPLLISHSYARSVGCPAPAHAPPEGLSGMRLSERVGTYFACLTKKDLGAQVREALPSRISQAGRCG